MSNRHNEIAERIVAEFKESLGDSVRAQITAPQFEQLALSIQEVLSKELGAALEQMEAVVKTLRHNVVLPEREL